MPTMTNRFSRRVGISSARRERHRGQMPDRWRRLGLQSGLVVLLLALWWLVSATELITKDIVPSPGSTFRAWTELASTTQYWESVGQTLRGAAAGLGVAIIVGIPLGLVTGTYPFAERSSRLLLDVLRAFPGIAMLPVFLLLFGATFTMKAVVVFIACVFIIILQAQYGASSVSSTIQETVRSYRIPKGLWFRRVILPSSIPSIMTGLRLAAALSVLVAIGVEVLTTVPGIGYRVTQAQLGNDSSGAWAYIFTAATLGYTIVRLSEVAESHLLKWRPPAHLGLT